MKRLGLTSVYLVFLLCLFALLSLPQSVVGQTAQANLVMLREFTLEPGGPAFTYEFTAAEDNPYTFAASWGSVVGLRLSLTGEGLGPLVQEGNPASLSFQARKGVKYTLKVSAAGQLPVTSVGQLQGGFQPGLVIAPVVAPATPIQLPGPESPTLVVQMLEPGTLLAGATPMPLPGPIVPELMAKLTMPINLEATLALLKARPDRRYSATFRSDRPDASTAKRRRRPRAGSESARIRSRNRLEIRLQTAPLVRTSQLCAWRASVFNRHHIFAEGHSGAGARICEGTGNGTGQAECFCLRSK